MPKAFVIDRTVLRSDPRAVLSFANNVVIIPGHVVDELELQPEGGETLRIIDGLMGTGDISKGVATPDGGVVVIDNNLHLSNNTSLRPTTNDNTLICVALRWRDIIRNRQQAPSRKRAELSKEKNRTLQKTSFNGLRSMRFASSPNGMDFA